MPELWEGGLPMGVGASETHASPMGTPQLVHDTVARSWAQWSHCGVDGQMSRKRTIARLPSA